MTKAIVIREKDVEKYLRYRCKEIGAFCWKWVSPGISGVPDRIVLWRSRVWFVELKSKDRKPTPTQRRVHSRMKDQGHSVYVLDSHVAVDYFILAIKEQCVF